MEEINNYFERVSRRDYIRHGSGLIGIGLLSGCIGGQNNASNSSDSNDINSTQDTSYSVNMSPVGELTFQSIPDRWIPYSGDYADMGVALGQKQGITGIGAADRYYTDIYEELPGVSFERNKIEENPEVRTKEEFYALDNDVHLYDPKMLVNWFDWDKSDIDEITNNVGPFIGNLIFRREDKWHDYRYYTLYGAFQKIAQLFQQQNKYQAFKELHDEFIENIRKQLPPGSNRPDVLLTFEGTDEPETFSPYRLNDKGTSKKQWRDLGVKDALAGTGVKGISTTDRGELDYESLLEIDPDVILVRGHERKSPTEFQNIVLEYMRDHPIGRELKAVQNGRVYRGGYLYQGPIHNFFLTERGAKQIYPDIFGEITSNNKLFDRQRISDIINGDI